MSELLNKESTVKEVSVIETSLSEIWIDMMKYAPSKIVGMLASLFLVPLYTNLLSPEEYGLYNVSTATLSFICIIFSDWIGLSALRLFKENKTLDSVKAYFATLLFLLTSNLFLMYLTGFFSFSAICDFFKVPSNLLLMVFVLIPPVAVRALLFQVLRAQIQPMAYTCSVIFNQLSTILIAVYFIKYWHMGAKALLLGMFGSIIITDVIMIIQSKINQSTDIKDIKFSMLNNFYKYGLPIALSSLGMWIISQSNKFVLQHYKGSYYNGILGVGYNLTFSIIMPLIAIITIAAIPRIFEKFESGVDTSPIITKLTGYYFLVFSPIVFILSLFSKEMVALFSNKSYADAHVIVPFLAVSMFALGLAEYTTIQYHLAKKTYLETIIRIFPGILGLILSIILIPKLGLVGVGVSTVVSYGAYLLLSIIVNIPELKWIPPYKEIAKTFIALFLSFAAYLVFHDAFGWVYQASLTIAIYVLSIKLQRY